MESAIYILQMIEIQNERFNIFFDSGCGDLVSKRDNVSRLESSECKHGLYKASLLLYTGREAVMSGVCIDQVTANHESI